MKALILTLLFISLSFANDIGTVEKVVIDDSKNQVALVQRGKDTLPIIGVGFKIKENDIIKTFDTSKIKIRFLDNTIVYVGVKTIFEISKYSYDKNNKENNKVDFKIKKGSYKIKTGNIEKLAPKQFKIQTDNFIIGINK
ncbi:hypothetical protein CPG37_11345 [Malaciobacter canalis]|uniref:FecR protein domain-containing protein n=1 Tax=Malaciobacter canalis TaxID=1912871 RepID=A0ABX4LRQ6_9BACT|nr:FecR domain-containing protein [Malaciobacter canalis]PHO09038.1 hypothetical protein CPG37_11345 [Malaciobacter canalis]QEE32313.1 hypothetical protein ACAN_0823 [Malaciobacter canalis]